MIVNLSEHKGQLDSIHGFKEHVTSHKTVNCLKFIDYKHSVNDYNNRYAELMRDKK